MKVFLSLAVLLLSCGIVFAQGLSIGANVGGSYNTMSSGIEGDESASGLGFGGGIAVDIDLLMFGAELDVLYSMYKYSNSINDIDNTVTVNNLVIPLLFKYKMAMPVVSPYFVLGPSLIYGMSGTYESNGNSYDIDSDDLDTDIGIQVGAGANLGLMLPVNVSPYARFQYNLTANDPDTDNSESAYDILFGVNFMYKIK